MDLRLDWLWFDALFCPLNRIGQPVAARHNRNVQHLQALLASGTSVSINASSFEAERLAFLRDEKSASKALAMHANVENPVIFIVGSPLISGRPKRQDALQSRSLLFDGLLSR